MNDSIPVLSPSISTTATTSQSTSTASSSMLTTAACTSLVPVPEQATPVALPLKPILHQITRDLTILTCSYLKFSNMFRLIVNKDSAKAFLGPKGMILALYNKQLESMNRPYAPLTLEQHLRSSRLGHPNGPMPSAEKIRNFSFDALKDTFNDTRLRDMIQCFPHLEKLEIMQSDLNSKIDEQHIMSDETFDSLSKLSKLHTLSIYLHSLTDRKLSFLSKLTQLKALEFGSINSMTDNTLLHLYGLPLEYLDIQFCPISERALAKYLGHPNNALHTLLFMSRSDTVDARLGSLGWRREDPTSAYWERIPPEPASVPQPCLQQTNDAKPLD